MRDHIQKGAADVGHDDVMEIPLRSFHKRPPRVRISLQTG